MKIFAAISGAAIALCLYAAPASAQATRTWVANAGNDANPCSSTAPCKTFAGAISKTAANGEINCLDAGAFGAVTIAKSITISCENGTAGVLATLGVSGIVINGVTSDNITLKGLDIEGAGTGVNGIRVIGGGVVSIQNVNIRNFRGAAGNGILFAPTAVAELYVKDTQISNSGASAGTAGIQIAPGAGGTTSAVIENVTLSNNLNGMVTTATNGVGVNVQVKNTTASGSQAGNGFFFSANSTNIFAMLQSVVSTNNSVGLAVTNGGVRIGNSMITNNSTASRSPLAA